jgi:DNA transformation protein
MDGEAIRDMLAPLGPGFGHLGCRRMFGGHGLYLDGLFFAIESEGELFLKADAQSVPLFEAEGSAPFTYHKNGKPFRLAYWRMPERALDEADELRRWVRLALAAAVRAKQTPPRKSAVRRPSAQAGGRPRPR